MLNLGLPHFRIDYHDFLRGSNSYVNYPDGGFLSQSYGINIFNTPGVLGITAHKNETVRSTLNVNEPVIAWGMGPSSTGLGAIVVGLGSNGNSDGYFYNVADDGTITQNGSEDTTQDYNGRGFVDVVQYNSKWYFTSRSNVIQCSLDLNTKDLTYWTTTKSKSSLNNFSPHPMVVYNNILWIADQNYLHKLDGTTATTQAFDLPAGWVITAMAVYNNLIYMAAEPYWNASSTYHGQAKIYTWNGYSDSWLDEYDMDARVNALYVFDGTLFCFTNYYLGYFDGVKVKPLRPLSSPVYKCQVTQVDGSMFYAEGTNLVRYGSPVPGTRRVFVKHVPAISSQGYSAIFSWYQKRLLLIENGASGNPGIPYLISDINDLGSGSDSYQFDFNPRFFSRQVRIRGIVVETVDGLSSGQSVDVDYIDHKGARKQGAYFGYGNSQFNLHGENIFGFDVADGVVTRTVQPAITITNNARLRYVDFYYEPSEAPLNN